MLAGFLILAYYSVIAGWAMAYIAKAFFGSFFSTDAADIKTLFDNFMASPIQQIFWHTLFMVITMQIVMRGVKGGLEQAVRILMPALFFILIILVGYAMASGDYQQGYGFFIYPGFQQNKRQCGPDRHGPRFFTLKPGHGLHHGLRLLPAQACFHRQNHFVYRRRRHRRRLTGRVSPFFRWYSPTTWKSPPARA